MSKRPRPEFLPFALPDIGQDDILEITSVLRSGWITTGPATRRFEQAFAAAVGYKHAVAVNSCTAAMHLALEAIGLQPGDEVITTPYTFTATAEVVHYFRARPVFVDVHPRTLNLRADLLDGAISPRTKAVIPVHIAGLPADMDSIRQVARTRNLRVIEDAAHASPANYRSPSNAGPSDAACFSFYATKTMTTGEGGMICTDDEAVADRCRLMSLHGISQDAWNRYAAEGKWRYEVVAAGYKYNMTDLAAAMGIAQLRKAGTMLARRREIAVRYTQAFNSRPALEPPDTGRDGEHAWYLYMLRLRLDRLRIGRGEFIEELRRRNIGASVHFIPLHLHAYYRARYGFTPSDFPVAYEQYRREVSLPIYSKMTDRDVTDVLEAVLDIADEHTISLFEPGSKAA